MTGANLTKILDLLPKRLRMTESDLKIAETDVEKRTAQYMSIKEWLTETQKTHILQGTKLEEKADTTVTACGYCNLIKEKGVSQDYV